MSQKGNRGSVYNDLAKWTSGVERMKERLRTMGHPDGLKCDRVRLERVIPLNVYALLVEFIADQPNGILTFLMRDGSKPAENVVWWDFVLATPNHLVAVHNGVDGLAADVHEAPAGFDIERFLVQNGERYRKRVEARVQTFERHEVYANQYYAYRHTAEWLRGELVALDASEPVLPGGVVSDDAVARREIIKLRSFGPIAMKHHVLAKSLVMNSAFTCEALVATLLRLGALPHLLQERQTLRPLLRANFMQKLEVLHAYTILFERPLDLRAPVVSRVRALMEKRNKYVHAEQSDHTRLEDVFFDGDFPLYSGARGQVVEFFKRTWLVPSKEEAMDALNCAENFKTFLFDAMRKENRREMEFTLDQPQLGFNLRTSRNSVVFPVTPIQSVFVARARHEDSPEGAAASSAEHEDSAMLVVSDAEGITTVPIDGASAGAAACDDFLKQSHDRPAGAEHGQDG